MNFLESTGEEVVVSRNLLDYLVKYWDESVKVFNIKGRSLHFTEQEVALIIGLHANSETVEVVPSLPVTPRNPIPRSECGSQQMRYISRDGGFGSCKVNSRFTGSTFAKTFRRLNAQGIRPDVLYRAVNVEQFDAPRAYKLNFLSVNRFERKKNIGLAISSFSLLQREKLLGDGIPEVTLTLVGGFDKRLKENVEYLQELKSLAEREGVVDRVAFVTSCSTAERNQLLAECVCVIYTPKDEHFGIVPLEAMAAQKPV